MYKAIDGLGTNDKLLEETLGKLNKDNAGAVWDKWDQTCGEAYGETFYQSFLGDADKSQKAKFLAKLQNLFKNEIKQTEK